MSYLFKNITETIIKEIDYKYPNIDIASKSKLFTGVFINYISSNFFRNKYDNFKVIEIESNNNLYYRIGYSQNKSVNIYDYFGKISPWISEIDKLETLSNKKIINLELTEDMKSIIFGLKIKNDFLSNVFEENEIKKKLIEIEKKEIVFEIIENLNIANIKHLIKEENINNIEDINSYFGYNCNIKYLDLNQKGTYFIAKNENSICGIALIINNPFVYLNESEKSVIDNLSKYKYLSYVNVNKEFLGLNLGVKLIEEIYKHCAENSYVYETSDYTNDGNKYLESKVSDLNEKYREKLNIIEQKDRKKKELLIYKESKKGKSFEQIKEIINNNSSKMKIKTS